MLTIGPVADDAAKAVAEARKNGIDAAHYDMIFLKPLDDELLEEVAQLDCPIITVEDGTRDGGLGSAVEDWLADHGYQRTVHRLGIPDRFIPQGTPAQLQAICGFTSDDILKSINELSKK